MKLIQPQNFLKGSHYLEEANGFFRYKTNAYTEFTIYEWDHGYPVGSWREFGNGDFGGVLKFFFDSKDRARCVIAPWFAWNGCSPKWQAMGRWWGTPDYPETILPSLIHDVLCYFIKTKGFPLRKDEVDYIFLLSMQLTDFKKACIYYQAVKAFSIFR